MGFALLCFAQDFCLETVPAIIAEKSNGISHSLFRPAQALPPKAIQRQLSQSDPMLHDLIEDRTLGFRNTLSGRNR